MGWNGTDLRNEFAELLNDTSTSFKALVLGWMNDVMQDISKYHNWPFYRAFGKKVLTANLERQNLIIASPGACSLAALAGGSLTTDKQYAVAVTFYDSIEKVETKLGTQATITPTGANLSITVTGIPVASEATIDSRRVYLRNVTDSGSWLLYSTISNNTATTTTITANASSGADNPPETDYLKILDGDITIPSISRVLKNIPLPQMTQISNGVIVAGTPTYWAILANNRIALNPYPSSALTIAYYFFRRPRKLYANTTDEPDLPVEYKELLKLGVIWKGFEYRERQEKETKRQEYEAALSAMVSNLGDYNTGSATTRDEMGTTDGYIEV